MSLPPIPSASSGRESRTAASLKGSQGRLGECRRVSRDCPGGGSKELVCLQIQPLRLVHEHRVHQLDRQPRFQRDPGTDADTRVMASHLELELDLFQVFADRLLGSRMEEVGLNPTRQLKGLPVVTPPSSPPWWLLWYPERRMGSLFSLPRRPTAAEPEPISHD